MRLLTVFVALMLAAAAPDPVLVEFLTRARVSVPDARSMTDVQLCPANGRGDNFVAFARRGEARSYYVLQIRPGRTTRLLDSDLRGDAEGLGGVAARAMERRMAQCRWVPADELALGWAAL